MGAVKQKWCEIIDEVCIELKVPWEDEEELYDCLMENKIPPQYLRDAWRECRIRLSRTGLMDRKIAVAYDDVLGGVKQLQEG